MSVEKGALLDGDRTGWSILDDGVAYPVAVLIESAIDHNSRLMMSYCETHGVSLAPHGKTSMTPYLFERQLADGAWAITAASVWQAMRMRDAGVDRILIANEVVTPAEVAWLADAIGDGLDGYCYVDSIDGVAIMAETLGRMNISHPVPVLVEVGVSGGRTGVRSVEDGLQVAVAVSDVATMVLTGVAGFEGIIRGTDESPADARVDRFLGRLVETANVIAEKGWFEPSAEVIVTAGGSAWFDHVQDCFEGVDIEPPVRKVLRSGCYITHDDGGYERSSPMGESQRLDGRLIPAMELWAPVLSRPEPNRAVVGIGKRDVTHDRLLPMVKKVSRRGSDEVESLEPFRVTSLDDQHAYLDVEPTLQLRVGDLVGFGISHPCLTFDRWRSLAVVDDDYRVIEVAETLF